MYREYNQFMAGDVWTGFLLNWVDIWTCQYEDGDMRRVILVSSVATCSVGMYLMGDFCGTRTGCEYVWCKSCGVHD
jgi:hypothetical protein